MTKKRKKILIVDDEIELVEMLKYRLELNNYDVITAADGNKALELVKIEVPDIIILDLLIPELDGYKVCAVLKNNDLYKNIPIVILSALAKGRDKKLGAEVGADAYITKPFESEYFLKKIEELLNK